MSYSHVFSTEGRTASSISNDSFLMKGDIFKQFNIFNSQFISSEALSEMVLRFTFLQRGIYTLQYNATLIPKEGSISKIASYNSFTDKEVNILTTANHTTQLITQLINITFVGTSISWKLNNILGVTNECRIEGINIFHSPYSS